MTSPAIRDFNAPFEEMSLDLTAVPATERPIGSRGCSSPSGCADSRRLRSAA